MLSPLFFEKMETLENLKELYNDISISCSCRLAFCDFCYIYFEATSTELAEIEFQLNLDLKC